MIKERTWESTSYFIMWMCLVILIMLAHFFFCFALIAEIQVRARERKLRGMCLSFMGRNGEGYKRELD